MGALTGTADQTTQETIRKVLCMRPDCSTVYVSPNRLNLRFSVKKVTKDVQLKELKWLVNLIKEDGINCPKTIIFCNTMNEIAVVVNHLILELGRAVFYPEFSTVQDNCILGIYHSNSWQSTKDRVLAQFKANGVKRILIATTALCMGVNFPDVRYIVNWGPARSILDQHQEAGRAGRDGKKSHVIIIYHGQQVGHCEQEVKDFVRAKGCYRVAAYKTLDATIEPLEPLHDCCSYCSTICKCGGAQCDGTDLPFESGMQEESRGDNSNAKKREVTPEDRVTLKEALCEVRSDMGVEGLSLDKSFNHGFSMQLIEDITSKCDTIFTLQDIMCNFPVFSISNSLQILELIQEVFMDIPNFEETLSFLNLHSVHEVPNVYSRVHEWFDFDGIDLGVDNDNDPELLEL